jgi:hypothetical protein
MNKSLQLVVLVIVSVIFFSGCATILGGKKNQLVVEEGSPPAAEIWLDGQKIGEAPLDVKLEKHLIQDGSVVEIKKEGYETKTVTINRKVHPWYTLADIVTGGIWFGIDLGTGNLYRPVNNKINYELEESN